MLMKNRTVLGILCLILALLLAFGLTPIMKGGDGWHNSVLQITLGYKFLTN